MTEKKKLAKISDTQSKRKRRRPEVSLEMDLGRDKRKSKQVDLSVLTVKMTTNGGSDKRLKPLCVINRGHCPCLWPCQTMCVCFHSWFRASGRVSDSKIEVKCHRPLCVCVCAYIRMREGVKNLKLGVSASYANVHRENHKRRSRGAETRPAHPARGVSLTFGPF